MTRHGTKHSASTDSISYHITAHCGTVQGRALQSWQPLQNEYICRDEERADCPLAYRSFLKAAAKNYLAAAIVDPAYAMTTFPALLEPGRVIDFAAASNMHESFQSCMVYWRLSELLVCATLGKYRRLSDFLVCATLGKYQQQDCLH